MGLRKATSMIARLPRKRYPLLFIWGYSKAPEIQVPLFNVNQAEEGSDKSLRKRETRLYSNISKGANIHEKKFQYFF